MLVRVKPTLVLKHVEAREETTVKLVTWSVCTVDLQDESSDSPHAREEKVWNDLLPSCFSK